MPTPSSPAWGEQQPSGMVESSSVTQEIAIRASFQGIPYGPTVDWWNAMPRAPGKGTWRSPCLEGVLPSLQSHGDHLLQIQIGHTLAPRHQQPHSRSHGMKAGVPSHPQLQASRPEIALEGSGLLIAPEPWIGGAGTACQKASGQRLRIRRLQLRGPGGAGPGG